MLPRISTIKLPSSPFARAAPGLALAFFAHFLALLTSGAGHGWNTPLWASFWLWIVLPLTYATLLPLGSSRPSRMPGLLSLAAAALIGDAALIWFTVREGTEYFWKIMEAAPVFPILWLTIWFSWQLIIAVAFARTLVPLEEMQ